LLKRAKDVIALGDLGKVVDFAIDQNRQGFEITKELEDAKNYLREAAKAKRKGSAEVELDGLSGTVSVVFSGLVFKNKKGADLKDLEANLKPEVFAKLFRKTIEIVPALEAEAFEEALSTLTEPERSTVKHFIETTPATGKVYVPR
jgi:hypothetical protein